MTFPFLPDVRTYFTGIALNLRPERSYRLIQRSRTGKVIFMVFCQILFCDSAFFAKLNAAAATGPRSLRQMFSAMRTDNFGGSDETGGKESFTEILGYD